MAIGQYGYGNDNNDDLDQDALQRAFRGGVRRQPALVAPTAADPSRDLTGVMQDVRASGLDSNDYINQSLDARTPEQEAALPRMQAGSGTKTPPPAVNSDSPRVGLMPIGNEGSESGLPTLAPETSLAAAGRSPGGMPQGQWDADYRWTGPADALADIQRGNVGNMEGFDDAKMGDQGHNTIKYVFGRLASNFPATPSGLRAMVQDERFKRAFPNASIVPGTTTDKIDFGDGRPVDVLTNADDASDTARGWAWQTMDAQDGGAGGGADLGMLPDGGLPSDLMQALLGGEGLQGNDTLERIQRELQALMGGQPSEVDQQALLGALR